MLPCSDWALVNERTSVLLAFFILNQQHMKMDLFLLGLGVEGSFLGLPLELGADADPLGIGPGHAQSLENLVLALVLRDGARLFGLECLQRYVLETAVSKHTSGDLFVVLLGLTQKRFEKNQVPKKVCLCYGHYTLKFLQQINM